MSSEMKIIGIDGIQNRMVEIQARLDARFNRHFKTDPPLKANEFQKQLDNKQDAERLLASLQSGQPSSLTGQIGSPLSGGGLSPMRPFGIVPMAAGGIDKANIQAMLKRIATDENIDYKLLDAITSAESNYNPAAQSRAGAQGLMQLMPATAKSLGVTNSFDPEQNARGAAKYLKGLINQYGDLPTAIAAYNAGPGNVKKYGGIPPFKETQDYVKKVMAHMKSAENNTR